MKFKTVLPLVAGPRRRRGRRAAEIIEQILVKVNGEIFTKTDLEQRQVAALRQKGQPIDLKTDPNNAQLRKALDEITPQIMVERDRRDADRAARQGARLHAERRAVQERRRQHQKDNKIETDEQFQAALKQENMTMADLRRNLERQMIVQRVQQNEVLGKIGVTDEEARSTTTRTSRNSPRSPTITLREILVAVPGDPQGGQRRRRRSGEGARPRRSARASPRAARASRSSPPRSRTRRRRPTPA